MDGHIGVGKLNIIWGDGHLPMVFCLCISEQYPKRLVTINTQRPI